MQASLAAYIRPRDETLRIRQALTRFLQTRLRTLDGLPPSRILLLNPTPDLTPQSKTGLDGVYERYFDALRANQAARSKVAALQAHIDNQRREKDSWDAERQLAADLDGGDKQHVQSYITLLRQQQRLRKIEVIHATLRQLDTHDGNPVRTQLDELLESTLGVPPEPPTTAATLPSSSSSALQPGLGGNSSSGREAEVEAQILRLKKEVLRAKHAMDASKALLAEARLKATRAPDASLQARVYALHCARDELIAWIEGELPKVANAGAEDAEDHDSMDSGNLLDEDDEDDENDEPGPRDEPYDAQLDRLYGNYLKARAQLVETMDRIAAEENGGQSSPSGTTSVTQTPRRTSRAQPAAPLKPCSVTEILPYLPDLLQVARDERALLEHLALLRRQLMASSDEKKQSVDRLADESHLVDPHSSTSRAWAKAAKEAVVINDRVIEQQLQSAEQGVAEARRNLDEVRGRFGGLGRLNGNLA